MKIERISQLFGLDLQKAAGNTKNLEKAEKPNASDSVVLSKKAKELLSKSGNKAAVLAQIAVMPEMRPEKIKGAKEKIASGYFETPEFMDRLADRLMKEFGINSPPAK